MSQSNPIVITLGHPENLKFLRLVFEAYVKNGMPPDYLPVAADTYLSLVNAREIPLKQNIGPTTISEAGPNGVALEFDPMVQAPQQ